MFNLRLGALITHSAPAVVAVGRIVHSLVQFIFGPITDFVRRFFTAI